MTMTRNRLEHHILWHCSQLASSEHAALLEREDGLGLAGTVVVPRHGVPCTITYEVVADSHWSPHGATVTVSMPSGASSIALAAEGGGRWQLDGATAPHLVGCGDLDLGWTPATNTFPIRRLALEVGQSAGIRAAWVRFPELDVVSSEQRYTRLGDDRWRYQSRDYDFELRVDPTTGLVLAYGDDLWRAAAIWQRRASS
jgi:hypothetical protein